MSLWCRKIYIILWHQINGAGDLNEAINLEKLVAGFTASACGEAVRT